MIFAPLPRLRALAFLVGLTVGAPSLAAAQSPVAIEGVEDDDLRREIVAALPERDPPESLFEAERLAEEAAVRVRSFLRSGGWYQGGAEAVAEDDPPRALVRVTLGARFRFAEPSVSFASPPAADAEAAATAAIEALPAGAPAAAAAVLAAEARAVEALRANGHPDARAGERAAVVDHADRTMRVAFALEPGPSARLGALRIEPEGLLEPDWPLELVTWRPGDPTNPEALALLRRDLRSTGVFSRVDVDLAEEADAQGRRDVVARLTPAPPRSLELGLSWSTVEGLGAEAEYRWRNELRRADTITADVRIAEREQRIAADLVLPHALSRGRARRWQAEIVNENVDPFQRQGARIATSVEAERRLRFATVYGVSLAADLYDARAGVENAVTASAFADLRRDGTDDPLDARRGALLQARLEPSVSSGDATTAFARITGEARSFWTPGGVDGAVTYAARLGLGWLQTVAGDDADLPLERRFFAGGGGSVRGYAFRSIFPDAESRASTLPPGGLGLIEGTIEVRARLRGAFGAAAFVDAGSAFNRLDDVSPRIGAGVGFRYDLGFAPLRVDLAVPLDRRGGEPEAAVYVSLGQAF